MQKNLWRTLSAATRWNYSSMRFVCFFLAIKNMLFHGIKHLISTCLSHHNTISCNLMHNLSAATKMHGIWQCVKGTKFFLSYACYSKIETNYNKRCNNRHNFVIFAKLWILACERCDLRTSYCKSHSKFNYSCECRDGFKKDLYGECNG